MSNEQTFNPLTRGSVSGGASRRQGLEIEWRAPVAPAVDLSGNWTLNDARYTTHLAQAPDPTSPPTVLNGLRVYNTARYVGSAGVDLAPRAASWRCWVSGSFVGPYSPFDEPGVVLAPYGLVHVSGAVTVRGTELDVGVRNALDRAYPELVAGHIVAPGQPRALYVTARYAF